VERLLEDDDETVRKKAIQAVSELEWASVFPDQLTGALKNGSEEERILVAAGLAHWNTSLLRQTIADANQPDKVRVAAMRSLDIYGDKEIAAWRDELRQALDTALQAKNEELRRAAIPALRYAQGSAYAWLALLDDDQQKEHHQAVLRTWADALDGETLSAMRRHWSETHEAWYRAGQAPRRWAVATYMMCEAAKMQMQQLDRTPPVPENAALADRQGPTGRAFDMQLTRLGNILSVVSAVRWYCNTDFNKDTEFTIWLPHETPKGRPPQRKLKSYMFQQVKPIWEWCLARQGAYSSRFLTADNIVRSYANRTGPQPVPPRPLGAVMDELLIGESEYQLLRKRYGEKQDGP
jgi:hypothetical protein